MHEELATLLERVRLTFSNKIFNFQSFIILRWKKCEKLANEVTKMTNKGLGTCFSKKSEEIGHILAEILADRLLLLKCYDNKNFQVTRVLLCRGTFM